jgi:hypothetical protein
MEWAIEGYRQNLVVNAPRFSVKTSVKIVLFREPSKTGVATVTDGEGTDAPFSIFLFLLEISIVLQ